MFIIRNKHFLKLLKAVEKVEIDVQDIRQEIISIAKDEDNSNGD